MKNKFKLIKIAEFKRFIPLNKKLCFKCCEDFDISFFRLKSVKRGQNIYNMKSQAIESNYAQS